MNSDSRPSRSFFTPTRVISALAAFTAALCTMLLVMWLSGPSVITFKVSAPVGRTVVCHFVVDGRAESQKDVAPVTHRFEANKVRYAVIALDGTPPSEVTVSVADKFGSGGEISAEGVTGGFGTNWWGTSFQLGPMTAAHVASMRKSVLAESESVKHESADVVP
ncbi:MAG: hypothetical protein KF861_21340 [Planctomycetaceae bacterium]|nr:hypothetical protein [Planctomycetaceae bacterium]